MGYSTSFTGHVTVTPPLNGPEMDYLRRFANKDHRKDSGMPGYHCDWVPTDDGLGIQWSGMEKFYDSVEWMQYLIDTFLKPGSTLSTELLAPVEVRTYDPAFGYFTFDHVVSGRIEAQGDDADDRWTLAVVDNVASQVKYPTLAEWMTTGMPLAAAFETLKSAGVTVSQYANVIGEPY